MKAFRYFPQLVLALVILGLNACTEESRFTFNSNDKTPPSPPEFLEYKPLSGGVRLFYRIPADENLLTVDAEYTSEKGKQVHFLASYFVDSLDVWGFADTESHTIRLYSTNRAGIRSEPVNVEVIPGESALPKVAANISIKPAVNSFIIDWENELRQTLNVYVKFDYTDKGVPHSYTRVFSSKALNVRETIEDLNLDENVPVSVKVWIQDTYDNETDPIDKGEIVLLHDTELPKEQWLYPAPGTVMGGASMIDANIVEGRVTALNDNIIDGDNSPNFMHAGANIAQWNVFIDLGDYYELTRISTWQRRSNGDDKYSKGLLYGSSENVGRYKMYRWDDETGQWEFLSEHSIPIPQGQSDMEIIKNHIRYGDRAYIHPEEPAFTKPTRWFRYEAQGGFVTQNSIPYSNNCACLSEISLWGRKANL
jgi:hypothetical protein